MFISVKTKELEATEKFTAWIVTRRFVHHEPLNFHTHISFAISLTVSNFSMVSIKNGTLCINNVKSMTEGHLVGVPEFLDLNGSMLYKYHSFVSSWNLNILKSLCRYKTYIQYPAVNSICYFWTCIFFEFTSSSYFPQLETNLWVWNC